ncbi:MAG: L-2-amino-thiazoline-4-carboxylic acid hydrolase [Bacteroidales bacterium]|nr:L-2-amino-thiazoline-4-carboxylic acid hydrolase [Bacteroidales bacterium]
MKRYTPLRMIRSGRYKSCFYGLKPEVRADVLRRMETLVAENHEWCDRGNYGHLCNILSTLAIDQALAARGQSADERLAFLSENMWAALNPKPMNRLARLPFFMPLMKAVVPLGFSKKSGKGWRYVWHKDTDGPDEFRFECTECLYQYIFSHYGVLDRFGPMFCHSDIVNYGSLPHTDFIRTQTLCQGGELCDFCFIRHRRSEVLQRTTSI